jgi:DNA-binding CsgD family transcriptional regulator
MTITRNRQSKTIVSQSIKTMSVEGYTIGRIAQILGVSEQLVSSALQGDKVGPVNDKAAAYFLAWQDTDRKMCDANNNLRQAEEEIATMMIPEPDTEAADKLEAVISEQADTIAVLKAALRNLI